METINDRIEMLVNERFNGNKAAFAAALGMGPTIMSSYLGGKRRSKPSVDMVTFRHRKATLFQKQLGSQ